MFEFNNYEFLTIDTKLSSGSNRTVSADNQITFPAGRVIAMATVIKSDVSDVIVNLSVLKQGNEIVRPADVTFYEKTRSGNFMETMRPVSIENVGGNSYEVFLSTNTPVQRDILIQTMFVVEKPQ